MRFLKLIKASLDIIRPYNCLFVFFTVMLGGFYLVHYIEQSVFNKLLFAGISAMFIAAAGYVINDFYDYSIDTINKPNRVLPKKKLSLSFAYRYAVALFLAGFAFAVFTSNLICILIAFINSITLLLYAQRFKKSFLVGNLIVAWNAASTFIFGAIITNNFKGILLLVIISFLYTILREFIKVIEDYEGDKANQANTLAVALGKEKALIYSYFPAGLMIVSVFVMFFLSFLTIEMFLILNIIIIVPLFVFFYIMHKSLHKVIVADVQKYMKLNMLSIVLLYITNDILNLRI